MYVIYQPRQSGPDGGQPAWAGPPATYQNSGPDNMVPAVDCIDAPFLRGDSPPLIRHVVTQQRVECLNAEAPPEYLPHTAAGTAPLNPHFDESACASHAHPQAAFGQDPMDLLPSPFGLPKQHPQVGSQPSADELVPPSLGLPSFLPQVGLPRTASELVTPSLGLPSLLPQVGAMRTASELVPPSLGLPSFLPHVGLPRTASEVPPPSLGFPCLGPQVGPMRTPCELLPPLLSVPSLVPQVGAMRTPCELLPPLFSVPSLVPQVGPMMTPCELLLPSLGIQTLVPQLGPMRTPCEMLPPSLGVPSLVPPVGPMRTPCELLPPSLGFPSLVQPVGPMRTSSEPLPPPLGVPSHLSQVGAKRSASKLQPLSQGLNPGHAPDPTFPTSVCPPIGNHGILSVPPAKRPCLSTLPDSHSTPLPELTPIGQGPSGELSRAPSRLRRRPSRKITRTRSLPGNRPRGPPPPGVSQGPPPKGGPGSLLLQFQEALADLRLPSPSSRASAKKSHKQGYFPARQPTDVSLTSQMLRNDTELAKWVLVVGNA
eukprot:jgi/Botrbrau1/8206/Bobra.0392s0005.2